MRVWRGLEEVQGPLPHVVLTVGNFDGMHLGHRRILAAVRKRAACAGGTSLALTFDPHPVRVLAPSSASALALQAPQRDFQLLTPLAEKIALLEAAGLDVLVILPFTLELSQFSPEEFVRRVVVERLQAREIFVGGNFRFGHRQAGNVDLLWQMGARLGEKGFVVRVVEPVQARGGVISSTRIRNLVAQGRVSLAARLLGRCYAVEGPIVPGRGFGHRQTVPTLNLAPYPELLPLRGVYITETECGGLRSPSVTNIGHNPTFGETELHLESHLLEGAPEAPAMAGGAKMRVFFHRRIREEMKFPSGEALRERIGHDIAAAERYFRRLRHLRMAPARSPSAQGA